MHKDFPDIIRRAAGAEQIELVEVIQELWSGYGTIRRYATSGARQQHVVVKHVHFADPAEHPRGWNTDLSHQRKLRSYRVEQAWYAGPAQQCDEACRVPHCLALESRGNETLMVLEDLDESGFADRRDTLNDIQLCACLDWLASFHARFMHAPPQGLWEQGTYWHLQTRPDELEALTDQPLKGAAAEIDRQLRGCRFRTFVHGDAKLANFCFAEDGRRVAAVDFQYVGGGCGMQDLAYFIGSGLPEADCERREAWLLEQYFTRLKHALQRCRPEVDGDAVEAEWRALFPLAWTDFHRFLKGWCPGHWKLNDYSERTARRVLAQLQRDY